MLLQLIFRNVGKQRQERGEQNTLQERGGTKGENRGCNIAHTLCFSLVTLPIESHILSDYVIYENSVEMGDSA
jgi:hypothetical protein